MRAIARRFRELLSARQGRVEVLVTTAVPLDEQQRDRIVEALRGALGIEPLLRTSVDANALGGMIVRIGDRVYDASVATELERLRQSLTAKRSAGG